MIGPERFYLFAGDNRDLMANMGDNTVDSVVTDGPYELVSIRKRFGGPNAAPQQFGTDGAYARAARGFMGQTWDGTGIVNDPTFWAEVLRVLKPGGFLLSFGGTRTYHRMACAIEDAGFEIRDMISWLYGSGFPKGSVVEGRGPALKPAQEPVCMARKPFPGSIARNVAEWGTGALRIDDCRVPGEKPDTTRGAGGGKGAYSPIGAQGRIVDDGRGRFPANVMHDGSDEVVACFPADAGGGHHPAARGVGGIGNDGHRGQIDLVERHDTERGSAARFFYCAKASKADREEGLVDLDILPTQSTGWSGESMPLRQDGTERKMPQRANIHPTVKPEGIMAYLVRLVTPPGGLVFDPFTGSGSTGKAAMREGMRFIGAEMTAEYVPIARARIAHAASNG